MCIRDSTEGALADLNAKFDSASAGDIVEWAVARFHPQMCLTASMTDAVLIDIATRVEPVSYTHLDVYKRQPLHNVSR